MNAKRVGRVLIVDDDPLVLENLRRALRREPYEILAAGSGAQGLEILARSSIDVVVSDERMPGMTGAEFLGIVCRKYPETVRIVLTGQASLEAAIRAINEGEIFRFLLKPCDPVDLAQTIQTAIELKTLRLESTRLLAAARHRGMILIELERRNPGITKVTRAPDGVIDLTPDSALDPETLIAEIRRELASPAPRANADAGSGTGSNEAAA